VILRIDLNYDFEWAWIAKLALWLPLPSDWSAVLEHTYEDLEINVSIDSDDSVGE